MRSDRPLRALLFWLLIAALWSTEAAGQRAPEPPWQEAEGRIEFYRQAIEAEPRRPLLHFQLGLQLFDLGKLDEARAALSEELRLNPGNQRCRVALGMVKVQQKEYSGAIDDLNEVLQADASLQQAYYPLGQAWYHLGGFQKARDYLEKAAQFEAPSATLYALLTRTYAMLGEKALATRATELQRGARSLALAQAAANLGSWAEAERLLSEFSRTFPHAANGLYLKAVIEFNGFRRSREAEALLKEVITGNAADTRARRLLAVLEWASGDAEAFEREMKLVLEADPLDGQAHYYMGRYLLERQSLTPAREHLDVALRLRPKDYRVHADLARLEDEQGHAVEAEQHYRAAMELSGERSPEPMLASSYAAFLMKQRRCPAAAQIMDAAVTTPEPPAAALHMAGLAQACLGNLDVAAKYLERAQALKPADADLHLALAEVYERTGKKAEAARQRSLARKQQ
jgi:tetratricopeptide (TPR) repeat protein